MGMGSFQQFCRNATDAQLLAILEREREGASRDPDRESDYRDARQECVRRGLEIPEEDGPEDGWGLPFRSLEEGGLEDPDPRDELAAILDRRGVRINVLERLDSRPGWTSRPGTGHVRLKVYGHGRAVEITYSAGSMIVARDVLERGPCPVYVPSIDRGINRAALESAARKHGSGLTIDEVAALERAAAVWVPDLIDVLSSMLLDCAGFLAYAPAEPTFREWLAEGLCDGMNAADALDCYSAIQGEYRFLARALADDLARAIELAQEV